MHNEINFDRIFKFTCVVVALSTTQTKEKEEHMSNIEISETLWNQIVQITDELELENKPTPAERD